MTNFTPSSSVMSATRSPETGIKPANQPFSTPPASSDLPRSSAALTVAQPTVFRAGRSSFAIAVSSRAFLPCRPAPAASKQAAIQIDRLPIEVLGCSFRAMRRVWQSIRRGRGGLAQVHDFGGGGDPDPEPAALIRSPSMMKVELFSILSDLMSSVRPARTTTILGGRFSADKPWRRKQRCDQDPPKFRQNKAWPSSRRRSRGKELH